MKKFIGLIVFCLIFNNFVYAQRAETVLTVLYYLDALNPTAVADANLWFRTFERNNPGVRIIRENLFGEVYHDKLRVYAAAGNLPDVIYVWPSGRHDYLHEHRLLKDLTPFIERDGIRNQFIPMAMDTSQQHAGYMAMIPLGVTSSHAFYTNMEVLNAVGLQPARSYAELVAQVPVLTAAGYETIIIPAESTWVMQSCLFSMIAGRFCGPDWQERILTGKAKFTDNDFVAAFDFIRRMYADRVISLANIGVSYGDGPGMFAGNRSAYYIDGDWRVSDLITAMDTSRQENFRIGVFPDIPGARINSSTSAVISSGFAMNASIPSGSERERLAWELIKWMVSNEVSTLRTERGNTPTPSRRDLNFEAMNLSPLQRAAANLGNEIQAATVIFDVVFPSEVFERVHDGLIDLAVGRRTAMQVAADIQRTFDNYNRRR
ncbi:MAG: extracellular solute-binding protein [Treponema sp.]|nr:extracellular solute-binding protein [Treponema sp.]